jgi:DNA-binding response OmpR family regulator
VLVVDDDFLLSEVIKRRLSSHGVRVERAFSGDDGLRKALRRQPDVIVTDFMMSDGDGAYLLRSLRADPRTVDIPVIVITGCDLSGRTAPGADDCLERRLLDLGAKSILRKPVDCDALLDQIRRHASRSGDRADTELIACP